MVFHVLLHALIDTAKLLPFLILIYYLIELLEYKNIFRFENSKLLNGKASPVVGALFGSVPQCGFSVISSELFAKRKISIAALVAVFVATSDEAIPLMLSNYKLIPSLLMLIACKLVIAILVGYLTLGLYNIFFKNKQNQPSLHTKKDSVDLHNHACCHHSLEDHKFDWIHPLVHSLKIGLYILIINFGMGLLVELIGEDKLSNFLSSSSAFQPLLALLIGLIPNCASSVILTQLYMMGGLSFGSIITGLCVNAGLGLTVLFKENKNIKENLFIVLVLNITSLLIGYTLHFIPFNFLKI